MEVANRPGLGALAWRVGTHGSFLETMFARLASVDVDGGVRPLAALTERSVEDPSIALLDAWASVASVLTFYTERIANEGYLRSATERRSVLELARLIGYELRPGVAATTYLAFTLEDGFDVRIPPGPGRRACRGRANCLSRSRPSSRWTRAGCGTRCARAGASRSN